MQSLITRGRVLAALSPVVLALAACHSPPPPQAPMPDLDFAAPVSSDGARLERSEVEDLGVTTMEELLKGRMAGVNVRTGRRGRLSIEIRGRSSFLAESEALIMIDGVESTANALLAMNPRDVQRVEVLKDGSAAIYGVRGGNGVLLITTRRQANFQP